MLLSGNSEFSELEKNAEKPSRTTKRISSIQKVKSNVAQTFKGEAGGLRARPPARQCPRNLTKKPGNGYWQQKMLGMRVGFARRVNRSALRWKAPSLIPRVPRLSDSGSTSTGRRTLTVVHFAKPVRIRQRPASQRCRRMQPWLGLRDST